MRRPRCILENRGDPGIRLGRRQGEVPSSLLAGRDGLREPRMQRPSARRRLAYSDCRSEQRVREAQTLAVELEDPRL
jgi:hypothetical protein